MRSRLTIIADPEVVFGPDLEPNDMQFRLTYEGPLLGASKTNTRAQHKHEIRRVFHRQLKRWWRINRMLAQMHHKAGDKNIKSDEFLAEKFKRNGYRFVPLATEDLALACGLHILFLRPDPPGELIKSGDIDNRLKTIFDSLRMPTSKEELGGYDAPEHDEDPFFVLLEDDRLVSQVSVDTDTMLESVKEFNVNDARLVITVTLKPAHLTWQNIGFG